MRADISAGADTWSTHLGTSGESCIIWDDSDTNRSWHIGCSDEFLHIKKSATNVLKEGMNMSRYISRNVLLLTFIVVIGCGLYPLSQRLIAQAIFPFEVSSDVLTGGSPQVAQTFIKNEYSRPRQSAASDDVSASTSSAVTASSNFYHQQSSDFGVAKTQLVERPAQRVCSFYDC